MVDFVREPYGLQSGRPAFLFLLREKSGGCTCTLRAHGARRSSGSILRSNWRKTTGLAHNWCAEPDG